MFHDLELIGDREDSVFFWATEEEYRKFEEYNANPWAHYIGLMIRMRMPEFQKRVEKAVEDYAMDIFISGNHHSPGSRLRNVRIGISMYYDWTEEYLRDVLVHKMLHYKLERSKNVEKKMRGPRFLKAAAEMNEKYGLNIQVHPTLRGLKVSAAAPKRSLAQFLWAPAS